MRILTLLILLTFLSCSGNIGTDSFSKSDIKYFKAIEKNDIQLSTPKEGEWLYEHKEPGQTFEEYKNKKSIQLNDSQNIIYLEPIGQFSPLQEKALELTREYVSIFFQSRTILLSAIDDKIIPTKYRRLQENNNEQLLAPYILDSLLSGKTPKNSIAFMAFTANDLYPKDDWNYIFGLGSYSERVGVTSIYRLENMHLDTSDFTQCLRRLINVSTHEIGHMFGFKHCTFARCVMNGSNSLYEVDLSPNRLCSQCQEKLCWFMKYDNRKRLQELENFFASNKLMWDYNYLKADIESLQ